MINDIPDLRSFEKGVFFVNTLGIIFDPANKKFLIARRENDPHFDDLKWTFPGGRPSYGKDLEESFEEVVQRRTGLKVKSLGPVFSRLFKEDDHVLLIYYLCEAIGGEVKLTEEYSESKWVDADELEEHFTTSFDPRLKEFIENLR
jgi:ADP-ribose pyrophosphatase YjhB (NUDIX family)